MTPFVARFQLAASFRCGRLAQRAVALWPAPSMRRTPPHTGAFRLMMQAGAAQLPMVRESLRSIAQAWSALPHLVLVTDGTVTLPDAATVLRGWAGPATHWTRHAVLAAARRIGGEALHAFAATSPVGLKFAAVTLAARTECILFADPDILWFGDAIPLVQLGHREDDLMFALGEDFQPAYDVGVAAGSGEELWEAPYCNSGVILLRGNLLRRASLESELGAAARSGSHFAEQTLFAIASRRLRAPPWGQHVIACQQSDQGSLGVTYRGRGWIARHYVGPVRHLFWRDALALRLGVQA